MSTRRTISYRSWIHVYYDVVDGRVWAEFTRHWKHWPHVPIVPLLPRCLTFWSRR